jgi:tetratricopeptide (TPR) repeat protein
MKLDLSIQFFEQALALARELDLQEHLAFVLTDLAGSYYYSGQPLQASVELEKAIPIWQAHNNLPMLAYALNQMAQFMIYFGRPAAAEAAAREAFAHAASIENYDGMGFSTGVLEQVHRMRGEIGPALDVLKQLTLIDHPMSIIGIYHSAAIYADVGACDKYSAGANNLLSQSSDLPPIIQIDNLITLSSGALLCTESGPVATRLEEITTGMDVSSTPYGMWMGLLTAAKSIQSGDHTEALKVLDSTLDTYERTGMRKDIADALMYKAQILRSLGQEQEALENLRAAAAESRQMEYWMILWRILAALVDLEMELGLAVEAEAHRREGSAIIDRIAASLTDYPDLKASLLATPQARLLRGESIPQ